MLDPLTIIEVHDILAGSGLRSRGIVIDDIAAFVVDHVSVDGVYVARGEDGCLHGAAFGWPIEAADGYDGKYVDEPDGTVFFCNMMVVDPRHGVSGSEVASVLARHVREAHPRVTLLCYQRAKHEDRMKVYSLGRLETHG